MTNQHRDPLGAKPWQAKISRRRFIGGSLLLAGAAGFAGYLPESLARVASAAPPPAGNFDLSQIKHLVFLMQENRSFDHYFGLFPGVAGFSDPNAIKLPNGLSVFQQPDPLNPDGYLEPFHLDTITHGGAGYGGTSHSWQPQHASWDNGNMDSWLRTHIAIDGINEAPYIMGYYNQGDLPFHWALAEAFTLCDHYHCSAMGPTDTNRLMWSNGSIDPEGLAGGPVLETGGVTDLTFESGAETLFNAGISFKQYTADWNTQWGYFEQLQTLDTLPRALVLSANGVGGTLWGNGTPGGLGNPASPTRSTGARTAFEEDCANGVLPDVSFIGTYTDVWEHPGGNPAAGAVFLAQKLDALAANADLWNTTVFVINYDENDGFFDHVPPPVPDINEFPEEFVTKASPAGTPGSGWPVGGGFRVPCFVISPWSTGGQIFSGISDHTSCLRLIESVAAAGGLSGAGPITFPNISRWRRQTFGDLTGALAGAAQPAPTSTQFDPTVRAANQAAQAASSLLPLPPVPGATQSIPLQAGANGSGKK